MATSRRKPTDRDDDHRDRTDSQRATEEPDPSGTERREPSPGTERLPGEMETAMSTGTDDEPELSNVDKYPSDLTAEKARRVLRGAAPEAGGRAVGGEEAPGKR
jgi:hypothetical protein